MICNYFFNEVTKTARFLFQALFSKLFADTPPRRKFSVNTVPFLHWRNDFPLFPQREWKTQVNWTWAAQWRAFCTEFGFLSFVSHSCSEYRRTLGAQDEKKRPCLVESTQWWAASKITPPVCFQVLAPSWKGIPTLSTDPCNWTASRARS
jgi:hypothetical protein